MPKAFSKLNRAISLAGRAVAASVNCLARCCGESCRTVFKVYPCQPYGNLSGDCPDPGPLWACSDALYSDGQPINTMSTRRLTYSGLCYAPGGGIGQPADETPTADLPPGTNVLQTGDFGFVDGCDAPECGSVRTFIRANLCSGQSTVGSTVTQVWVCAGTVARLGCGVISRGSSDAEPSLCWLVTPSNDAVDEDDIGTTPDIVKVFDNDYNPDPRGCCFCVSGCNTSTAIKRECVGSVPGTTPIECCCDVDNYRVRVTGYGTTNQFFDTPPASFSSRLVRPGLLAVVAGVIQPESVTTLIEQDDGAGPFIVDIGYPPFFCSDFVLPVIPPAGTTSGMGQQCSIDLRDGNGIGDVVTVGYTHGCTQQGINAAVDYYQPFGGNPTPRIRNRSTYSYSIERDSITTARCSGECPPVGGGASLQAFNRLLGLSTQKLSDILRRA